MSDPQNPTFDPSAPHHQKPVLRPVRGFPAQAKAPDGSVVPMLGLADMRQISDRVVVTSPAAQQLLPLMDGSRDIDQLVSDSGRDDVTREIMEQLVAQFDAAGLIEGPVFDEMLATMRSQFDSSDVLPPGPSADFADALVMQKHGKEATDEQKAEEGPGLVRQTFDAYIDKALEQVANPSFDTLPKAIVAPHLDYQRGWFNYANIYGRLRVCDRPDRIIILGTNHFGLGTGIVGCNKSFKTPLGDIALASDVESGLRSRLGDQLFEHRFDHEREHSIELHLMWIQHVFGTDDSGTFPKVFGALVHDPTVNNGESYDGTGVSLQAFVDALKETVSEVGGRTLIVASADLSHVGPAFGDQQTFAGEEQAAANARATLTKHDQEMLQHVVSNKPDDLVSAMAWTQNPTRWCSIGNLAATMHAAEAERVELLNYGAAMDPQGTTVVSSAALAMW